MQFVEGAQPLVARKNIPEAVDRLCLLITQFSVAVGVPMSHTEPFGLWVGETDDFVVEDAELQLLFSGIALKVKHLPYQDADDARHEEGGDAPLQVLSATAVEVSQEFVHLLVTLVDG